MSTWSILRALSSASRVTWDSLLQVLMKMESWSAFCHSCCHCFSSSSWHTHTIVLLLFWNLSGTTRVSRYQKGKTNLDLLEQETASGSGICWAICKSAPHPRQLRPPHSYYRPDALPAAQPTASKYTHTTVLRLCGICPRQPGWAGTRRNIHPLTLIVVINHRNLLSPSTMIHGIIRIQSTCCTVFFHNLSPSFLWSTSWSGTLHFILYTFVHLIIVFFSQPLLL